MRSSWRPTTTTSGSPSRWRRCCTSASRRRLNLSATTRRRPCGPTTRPVIRAAGPSRTPSASPRPATCSRRLYRYSPSSSGGAASCSRRRRPAEASPVAAELLLRRRPLLRLRGRSPTAAPSTRTRGGAGSSARRIDRVRSRLFARVDGVDAVKRLFDAVAGDRLGDVATRFATASFNAVEAAAADGRARVQALRAGRLLAKTGAAPRTASRWAGSATAALGDAGQLEALAGGRAAPTGTRACSGILPSIQLSRTMGQDLNRPGW